MTQFFYAAFGLVFRSAFPVHALEPRRLPASQRWDVDIRLGDVPSPRRPVAIDEMFVEISADAAVLEIPESGVFRIAAGSVMEVRPWPGATADQTEAYLLGTCVAVLLYQRRLLPLLANCVVRGNAAFAVCGDSGAGKSTLAADFSRAGLPLLTDDLLAIEQTTQGLKAHAGIPRMKLWRDALHAFGQTSDGLRPVSWMEDKFEIPLSQLASGSFSVGAIYWLRLAENGETAIERLEGAQAVAVIVQNIYRRQFADMAGESRVYFETAARLAQQVPVFAFSRPAGFEHFEASAAALVRHMDAMTEPP